MTATCHSQTKGTAPDAARRSRGKRADLSGRSAEISVIVHLERNGLALLETRWRGQGGEIDLIFSQGDQLIFVEVKQARSHAVAVAALRPAQMRRIMAAASEYLAFAPNGQLSDVRFDLATVDGAGHIDVIENAFGHF